MSKTKRIRIFFTKRDDQKITHVDVRMFDQVSGTIVALPRTARRSDRALMMGKTVWNHELVSGTRFGFEDETGFRTETTHTVSHHEYLKQKPNRRPLLMQTGKHSGYKP
jgi:hypothetical protein